MRRASSWFVLLILAILPGRLSAADKTPDAEKPIAKFDQVPADLVKVERDIAYLPDDRTEKADLYQPAKAKPGEKFPGVVIIHGGGWVGGDKSAGREINIGTNLAMRGYVALSINYVLGVKGKPCWPQNLYDCKTAVRWLRKNAARLHLDSEHIGVIGGSAGGHLAAMVTLTGPNDKLDPPGPYGEFSCQVQAGVDLYGPADLMSWPKGGSNPAFPATRQDNPELFRLASPVSYADKNDPPLLIMHGTADTTVPLEQSQLMAAAMKKAGARHELIVVEGAPHTFHLQPKQRDLRSVVLGFFDKNLKP